MFYPFLCGAFHQEQEDVFLFSSSPVCSPRKSRRKKDSKNPYSTRGLDQFSALLAELEEKRQQIYSQMGSQGIVRFVYKNSNDCVPVVVKLKDKKDEKIKPGNSSKDHHHQPAENDSSGAIDKLQTPSESDKNIHSKMTMVKKTSFSWNNVELQNLRRPSYYMPTVIIVILMFLVFFGRSVAILCTCIGWYIVPTMTGEGSNLRTSMKKKDYVRKLSGNNSVSGKLSFQKSNKFGARKG